MWRMLPAYFCGYDHQQITGFNYMQVIFNGGGDESEQGPSLFSQAVGIFKSLNRFMKVISKWNCKKDCDYASYKFFRIWS